MGFFIWDVLASFEVWPIKGVGTMKKLICKILLINLAILLSLSTIAIAASNSHSIRVSCTIPEIPGLNAPLIEEKSSTKIDHWEEELGIQAGESSSSEAGFLQEESHNLYTFYTR